jgi:hypothetical protein
MVEAGLTYAEVAESGYFDGGTSVANIRRVVAKSRRELFRAIRLESEAKHWAPPWQDKVAPLPVPWTERMADFLAATSTASQDQTDIQQAELEERRRNGWARRLDARLMALGIVP